MEPPFTTFYQVYDIYTSRRNCTGIVYPVGAHINESKKSTNYIIIIQLFKNKKLATNKFISLEYFVDQHTVSVTV
ncbi:MAG: hypothetical protein ACI8RD_007282 [Bacillariaceae sp.]|jgi:hypothetical protein